MHNTDEQTEGWSRKGLMPGLMQSGMMVTEETGLVLHFIFKQSQSATEHIIMQKIKVKIKKCKYKI